MSENNNQQIVNKAQAILKEFGHEVKLGHLYEMFSKLEGYKSWNVAKAKAVSFTDSLDAESKAIEEYWEELKAMPLEQRIKVCLGPINHCEEQPGVMIQYFGPYVKGLEDEFRTATKTPFELVIENSEFEVVVRLQPETENRKE